MIRRLAGLLLGAALMLIALPAAAHDQLIASTPAAGDVLSEAPAQIELEFNAEIIDATTAIIIQDDDGRTVHQAAPSVDGRFVRAPFPELEDGAYRLNWSVVSSDGHRIEGTIAFTRGDGAVPTAGSPAATEPGAVAESETAPPAFQGGGLATLSTPMKAIVGLVGLSAVGVAAALAVRRLRTKREDQP